MFNNQDIYKFIVFILISYLIGGIPFAWIMTKLFKKGDIRKQGTGNVGGGNVMTVVGPVIGTTVLILDILKGVIVAWLSLKIFQNPLALTICGLAAVIGHCYSVFLKFSGGKGVATTLGVYAVINWHLMIVLYFIWGLLKLISKRSGELFTLVLMIGYPFFLMLLKTNIYYTYYSILVGLFLIFTHRDYLNKHLQKLRSKK